MLNLIRSKKIQRQKRKTGAEVQNGLFVVLRKAGLVGNFAAK